MQEGYCWKSYLKFPQKVEAFWIWVKLITITPFDCWVNGYFDIRRKWRIVSHIVFYSPSVDVLIESLIKETKLVVTEKREYEDRDKSKLIAFPEFSDSENSDTRIKKKEFLTDCF